MTNQELRKKANQLNDSAKQYFKKKKDWIIITNVSDKEKEEVINMMKQGYSYGTIETIMGLSHEQVFAIIDHYMVIMGHKKDY